MTAAQRSAWRAPFILFTGANASFTGVGGLRGAPLAEFPGIESCDCWRLGCAAVAAGFVKSCGDGVLDGSALRTDTAGPPGQPVEAVPTWVVVGSAFVVVSSFWEYGVQPAFLAAAWASAVGYP